MIKTIGNAKEVVQGNSQPVYLEQLSEGTADCSITDRTFGDCPETL